MNPLSAEQIDQFQADLRAALLAGVPLNFGPDRKAVDELALERLGRHARSRVASGGLSDAALAEEDAQLPLRYRAALALWAHTQDMPLVLEGLSTQRRAERSVSRSIRTALVYLLLVLVVGYAGLAVFASFTAPRIDAMHADLTLVPKGSPPAGFDLQSKFFVALILIPLAAVALIAWGSWAGGLRAARSWLGVGGYCVSTAAAAATRIAQALISHGVAPDRAVTVACDVVDAGPKAREQVARPRSDGEPSERSEAGLALMGQQFRLIAAERLATLAVVAPVVLVVVIGGAMALAYTAGIFGPVVALYRDLISPGAWSGAAP